GGKTLLEKYRAQTERVPIADPRAALDLDTPEAYANARAMIS
ncbi:MAG: 4-diphosphocytidyl-2C-methyl-D-erythritol synthase, partial [Chloroflexi bacterium]